MAVNDTDGLIGLAGVVLLALLMAVGLLCVALTDGCGYGATTCAVVDVAKTVCDTTPVRYLDSHGREQTEQVPTSELRALAERTRASRFVDGGAE
jgi:hypothetical protein